MKLGRADNSYSFESVYKMICSEKKGIVADDIKLIIDATASLLTTETAAAGITVVTAPVVAPAVAGVLAGATAATAVTGTAAVTVAAIVKYLSKRGKVIDLVKRINDFLRNKTPDYQGKCERMKEAYTFLWVASFFDAFRNTIPDDIYNTISLIKSEKESIAKPVFSTDKGKLEMQFGVNGVEDYLRDVYKKMSDNLRIFIEKLAFYEKTEDEKTISILDGAFAGLPDKAIDTFRDQFVIVAASNTEFATYIQMEKEKEKEKKQETQQKELNNQLNDIRDTVHSIKDNIAKQNAGAEAEHDADYNHSIHRDYMETLTWEKTIGRDCEEQNKKEALCALRDSYEEAVSRTEYLAKEILQRMPLMDKFDLSHIDTLWQMTDLLLWDTETNNEPDDSVLNPLEAYVLGVSFLIRELGIGLVAYNGGIDDLKENIIFLDDLNWEFKNETGGDYDDTNERWKAIQNELKENKIFSDYSSIIRRALVSTLSKLYIGYVVDLNSLCWETDEGTKYIIDDKGKYEFRTNFGKMIGEIVASCDRKYDDLQKIKNLQKVDGFPRMWSVDAQKIACILRVTEIMHIFASRVPTLMMLLEDLSKDPIKRSTFQGKLYPFQIQGGRILCSSRIDFTIQDIEAWWQCYDTLCVLDRELREANGFLRLPGMLERKPFMVNGVYGLSSTDELKQYIIPDGWDPQDTSIRVGDVGRLVEKLGGAQLYGEDSSWVPFRELIQNGSDAIRARNKLDHRDDKEGTILIEFNDQCENPYISFTDNGIGMSKEVLTGPFLDFGQSFWNTPLMCKEWPGLASKGFRPNGKYGIGFYSVFIWSNNVKVITKKCKSGSEPWVIEFNNGTQSRPILRKADVEEEKKVQYGGTSVIIYLPPYMAKAISTADVFRPLFDYDVDWFEYGSEPGNKLSFCIAYLCPCTDYNITIINNGIKETGVVLANDWQVMNPVLLLLRMGSVRAEKSVSLEIAFDGGVKNMTLIEDDSKRIIGRGFLYPECDLDTGIMVVDGFRIKEKLSHFCGVIMSSSSRADRSVGISLKASESIKNWLEGQADGFVSLYRNDELDPKRAMAICSMLFACGVPRRELALAHMGCYLNYYALRNRIRKDVLSDAFIIYAEDVDLNWDRCIENIDFSCELIAYVNCENVINLPEFFKYKPKDELYDMDSSNPWTDSQIKMLENAILDGLGVSYEQRKDHCFDYKYIDSIDYHPSDIPLSYNKLMGNIAKEINNWENTPYAFTKTIRVIFRKPQKELREIFDYYEKNQTN